MLVVFFIRFVDYLALRHPLPVRFLQSGIVSSDHDVVSGRDGVNILVRCQIAEWFTDQIAGYERFVQFSVASTRQEGFYVGRPGGGATGRIVVKRARSGMIAGEIERPFSFGPERHRPISGETRKTRLAPPFERRKNNRRI